MPKTDKPKMLMTTRQADALWDKLQKFCDFDLGVVGNFTENSKEARAIAKRGLALADSLRKAFGAV